MLVLNNMFPKEPLKTSDVETRSASRRLSMDLPYDPLLYVKAVNEGVPVITGAPKSRRPTACRASQRLPLPATRPAPRHRRRSAAAVLAACSAGARNRLPRRTRLPFAGVVRL